MRIKLFYIKFNNYILDSEIELFRGAVISKVPRYMILFHNHEGEGFRYSYPLIQYKRLGGKAFIVCISEGTEDIGKLFSSADLNYRLGERTVKMEIASMWTTRPLVQVWNQSFSYRLVKWLALNEENYRTYQELEGIGERIELLEKILTGNILSFAKGIGYHIEEKLECKIISEKSSSWNRYKGVKMKSFDLIFKSNISLPEYIGLGKGASIGHGVLFRI